MLLVALILSSKVLQTKVQKQKKNNCTGGFDCCRKDRKQENKNEKSGCYPINQK